VPRDSERCAEVLGVLVIGRGPLPSVGAFDWRANVDWPPARLPANLARALVGFLFHGLSLA